MTPAKIVTPAKIAAPQPPPPIEPPTQALDPALIDPFQQPMATARREQISELCLSLPEACSDQQFYDGSKRAYLRQLSALRAKAHAGSIRGFQR